MEKTQNNYGKAVQFLKKYQTVAALVVIGVFSVILFRSIFYGIATPDESFYLTIPFRLVKGDALIVDEWHASQFSAALLYLPMQLFMSVTGGTDGIMLYFRGLFCVCQVAVSCFTFYKMKKYGTVAALTAAVLYLLYVPETVKMLDYYTMSLMGFQVTALMLFCTDKFRVHHFVFTGIVFACTVLAQPFNCIVYFLYFAAFIVYSAIKKKKDAETKPQLLQFRSIAFITLGIVLVAVIFLIFLFSQITLQEFAANFSNVFGGQDHTLPFSDEGNTDMFAYMTIFETLFEYSTRGFVLSIILIAGVCIDRERIKHRSLWIFGAAAVCLMLTVEIAVSTFSDIAAVLFKPYIIFVMAFVCLKLTAKKDKKLMCIWLSGVVYIIFLGLISQALDYVGVIGCVVSNTVFMAAFIQLYGEIKSEKAENAQDEKTKITARRVLCSACAAVLVFDISTGVALKFINDTTAVAMDRDTGAQEVVIDNGPLKGIVTDSITYDVYNNIIADTETIKAENCDNVLVAGLIPWVYFCFNGTPATFTTWFIEGELNLYDTYYSGNPEKIPRCVYIPDTTFYWDDGNTSIIDEYNEFFGDMFDETLRQGNAGNILFVNQ